MKKYRIGIDVGGTFTDAVAIDNDTYELVGSVKMLTTHNSEHGVGDGIVQTLHKLMDEVGIQPNQISFIAHGTTQATNALLEGDVANVGIIATGQGLSGKKAKTDSEIGDIPIADGKLLRTKTEFINSKDLDEVVPKIIQMFKEQGYDAIVATEAFGVDNTQNEKNICEQVSKVGLPATAASDVSKLYGLKVRTRTAVVNASILPKMIETANLTDKSIKDAEIESQLMVMRCDGGVMTVDELRSRPILTILSGPAAGVAGALMYEKLTDGIFLEVGGTSTDISCVKDGNVMIKYAEVGGHNTYLSSLDIRTVGIGGGSMVQVANGLAVDAGPRSAHIAKLDYEVFADVEDLKGAKLGTIKLTENDHEYAYVVCDGGKEFALTLTGAANICGYIPEGDYAFGNKDSAELAWEPLAHNMGMSVEETAKFVLDKAALKNKATIDKIVKDYGLDYNSIVFVGGGGGASSVVPHLGEQCNVKTKVAKNASVISPIGVALAMVRDMVERTITDPSEQDILAIRQEALELAVNSGASRESVEVKIEVDSQQQKVRAIAIGTTELRTKELGQQEKNEDEIKEIVSNNLNVSKDEVEIVCRNSNYIITSTKQVVKQFRIFKKKVKATRVVDREGIIRLQKKNAEVFKFNKGEWKGRLSKIVDDYTHFGDGGEEVPNIYIINGSRIIDLSGMRDKGQIMALAEVDIATCMDEELIVLSTLTSENERG